MDTCQFTGPAGGESALKGSKNIEVRDFYFNLRYPFWHDKGLVITDSEMTENCRAALWYSKELFQTLHRRQANGNIAQNP